MPSKLFMRFSALDSDSESSPSPSPIVYDADAELRARFQSLCVANGLDRLFAEEDRLDAAWSGTAVQAWQDGRLVMARPLGRVGVWGTIFESDIEEMDARAHAEWLATDHAARAAADAAERLAYQMKNKAERVACRDGFTRTKSGAKLERLAQPCKFLYDCQGTPAKPTKTCVSSKCWSHAEGVCIRAHPGDALWQPEWANFASLAELNAAIRGAPQQKPQQQQRPQQQRPQVVRQWNQTSSGRDAW